MEETIASEWRREDFNSEKDRLFGSPRKKDTIDIKELLIHFLRIKVVHPTVIRRLLSFRQKGYFHPEKSQIAVLNMLAV